ncbi:MAG: glycosyltransferase, partial [Flavobacterium sp.]
TKDTTCLYKAYKIIKAERPDVIHAHSAKGGVIGRIVGKLTGTPVLFTPHAFSYLSAETGLKRRVYLAIEKLLRGSSTLLATSQSEARRGMEEVGFSPNKTIVFNNSINPVAHIQPLTLQKTWPDTYLCTIGRPSYQKNIELMIEALYHVKQQLPQVHLVVVGVGFLSDKLSAVKDIIRNRNLESNVTIIDWTSRENTLNILSHCSVYLSTSRYEGLPYAVIEALALQKPCVVSDCDGNKDLVENGYNGYVIPSENPADYAEKILALLHNDGLQKQFSEHAGKMFSDHFNLQNNISLIENIYKEAAARK